MNLLSKKRLTIPRLSPTHTRASVVRYLVPDATYVREYDPVLILRCSPNLIADPADRLQGSDHEPLMLVEAMEEGVLQWDRQKISNDASKGSDDDETEMMDVGALIGTIDDDGDDDIDEDWTWQAYLHDDEEDAEHLGTNPGK